MKPSVYIETTIPSYLTAWPSRDLIRAAHQQLTREWWQQRSGDYRLYISQVVVDEVSDGDAGAAAQRLESLEGLKILDVPRGAEELARRILSGAGLPERAATDALHIAVAAWHGMDFLLTWNCAHINNPHLLPLVERACRAEGYSCPVICTPEELRHL